MISIFVTRTRMLTSATFITTILVILIITGIASLGVEQVAFNFLDRYIQNISLLTSSDTGQVRKDVI